MKKNLKKIISNKRIIVIVSFVILVLLLSILNSTFSAFTNKQTKNISNIKVNGMEYSVSINGTQSTMVTVANNKTVTSNITINSLNNVDSKYELIYKICTDIDCTNPISKPEGLSIEYSSKTIDTVSGSINRHASKNIRIITVNETNQTYYIKLDINAGYIHNTLALKKLIIEEYNEEDIIIAAIVDGEISTTFPTTNAYTTEVNCETNGGPSNASGTVTWNGSKWILNITGVDSGRTICNVGFYILLKDKILAQGGGAAAIAAKPTPNFDEINGTSGLYAMEDEYGISYYYRGIKEELNNNLIWGGFQWKIIRINGDGSVRLIYNGTESQFDSNNVMNDIGSNIKISGTHAWNSTNIDDVKYLGYMYGGLNGVTSTMRNGSSSAAATYNETSTNIKTVLENWYYTNIVGKPYESDVVDNLFCNDRQLRSEVGGGSTGPGYGTGITTYYAAYHRLYVTKNPTLKCGLKNDRFTESDLSKGNGALTHPVGLLTADEAALAGMFFIKINSTNYLRSGLTFWLSSPAYYQYSSGNSYLYMFSVGTDGSLNQSTPNYIYHSVRPLVSIKSDTRVTGSGSVTNPFKVK